MDVAVIGAAGACGRQTVMQLLERRVVPEDHRLQLVGHREGRSAGELWGLRADLADAFDTYAPHMDVVLDPEDVRAQLVIMMAGRTIPTDPGAPTDRLALGASNAEMFAAYAEAFARLDPKPLVVVQSNPVELAVQIFAEKLGPYSVIGAAGRSDSQRFAREIAADLGVSRRKVQAFVIGQHGDHAVPLFSLVRARGVEPDRLAETIATIRQGRSLADLPQEIAMSRNHMVNLLREAGASEAFAYVQSLPADLRSFVKPFFTHFTAGHTTEAVTAKSAVDMVAAIIAGESHAFSAQVVLEGPPFDLHGVAAVPVIVGPQGVAGVVPIKLADDEGRALESAVAAVHESNAAALARAGL